MFAKIYLVLCTFLFSVSTAHAASGGVSALSQIILAWAVLLSLIALAAWQIGRLDKYEETEEGARPLKSESQSIPDFASVDEAERFIREYYAKETGEKTENRTYAEILELEMDEERKRILQEIFSLLEKMRYAGGEADLNELNQRIKRLADK